MPLALLRSHKLDAVELTPSLRAIARAGAGVNNVPVSACTEQGVVVFNTPGANANSVKELVLAALLPAGLRGLVVAGLLAALMSSLSSVFNSCSTLVTFDIYRKLQPDASEKKLVLVGQITTLLLVLVAFLILATLSAAVLILAPLWRQRRRVALAAVPMLRWWTVGYFGLLGLGFLIGKGAKDEEKLSPYECGFEAFEDTRTKFDVRYYLVAILFIIFDLEIAFLFPWAVSLDTVGKFGLLAMGLFLAILVVGFIYEWKKGALEWD